MQYSEFIEQVQTATGLDTRAQAESITKVVLETFGQRLDRTVRHKTAAQLPNELKEIMIPQGETTERYLLSEFYNRVAARADLPYPAAARRSKQVLSVFRQAITSGSLDEVIDSLPDEYSELFGESGPNLARPTP